MRQLSQLGTLALLLVVGCRDDTAPAPTPVGPSVARASKGSGGGSGGGTVGIVVTSASLVGTALSVNGVGARPSVSISVNGAVMGAANSVGSFTITNAGFTSATCAVAVSDGVSSTNAALSPCTPAGSAAGAPRPLAPVAGAAVLQPVTLSWSAATAATPLLGYNWAIATTSGFTSVVLQNSTNAPITQDTFSGLPNGTYWWRVQAVEQGTPASGPVQGAWSAPISFTITGAAAGTPGAPTITFPASGAQYHPHESFYPRWTAVANASAYEVEYSLDAAFTPGASDFTPKVTTSTGDTLTVGNPLTLWARVRGISAAGVRGVPSATVRVVITYTAPIGPPPTLLAPLGAQGQLPITFRWTAVQNPQLEGYTLQIASEPTFRGNCTGIEYCNLLITGTSYTVVAWNGGFALPRGTHYWRVLSTQGDASPTLPALTAWSKVGTFVVP